MSFIIARRLATVATLLGLALTASPSRADIIVDHSPPGTTGYYSDVAIPAQIIADNFTLATAAAPDSITFWGGYVSGNVPLNPDLFSLAFYDNAGGLPGTLISSFSIAPSRALAGGKLVGVSDTYLYTAGFASVNLVAGTYWVSVVNDSSASPANGWVWASSANPYDGVVAISHDSSRTPTNWFNSGSDMAFTLSASRSVPEPSSMVLAGLGGLFAMAYRIRRRRG